MKHAKSLISQADYYPKDGDQLWCVFDCDDKKNKTAIILVVTSIVAVFTFVLHYGILFPSFRWDR